VEPEDPGYIIRYQDKLGTEDMSHIEKTKTKMGLDGVDGHIRS